MEREERSQEDPPLDDDHDEMIEPDADPLDTEVEDADLFLGDDEAEESA